LRCFAYLQITVAEWSKLTWLTTNFRFDLLIPKQRNDPKCLR